MTIAAGFRCQDGAVVCADTEISIRGWLKYPGSKIKLNQRIAGKPCFTFAGDVDFCEMAIPKLGTAASNAIEKGNDPVAAMEEVALEIHRKYISEDYELESAIIACIETGKEEKQKRNLFKITRGIVSGVSQVCLGSGQFVAQAMIAEMFRPHLKMNETAMLCVFLLAEAKTYAGDCGKESHIILLPDGKNWGSFPDIGPFAPTVGEIEEEYRRLKTFLRPLLLEYGLIHNKPEKLELALSTFRNVILQRRKVTFEKACKLEADWFESHLEDEVTLEDEEEEK